ncbi:MAG: hypothetical protein IT372_23245 [Polyangiaceae bacterium]|nr:hypothetical protein [Polyangiaceae bacterium]
MERFVVRYGSRSEARFTILGTVARVGWKEPFFFTDEERRAARGVTISAQGAPSGTKSEPATPATTPRGVIWQTQAIADKVRGLMMSGGDATSVFVVPLAIYRVVPRLSGTMKTEGDPGYSDQDS